MAPQSINRDALEQAQQSPEDGNGFMVEHSVPIGIVYPDKD
jgi:hypothetical protein